MDEPFVFQKKIKWELVPSWDGDGETAIKWIKEVDRGFAPYLRLRAL
jgi:hypothetical protein